jgi:hypothetical protein
MIKIMFTKWSGRIFLIHMFIILGPSDVAEWQRVTSLRNEFQTSFDDSKRFHGDGKRGVISAGPLKPWNCAMFSIPCTERDLKMAPCFTYQLDAHYRNFMLKYSPETRENNDNFMSLIPRQHISGDMLDSVRCGLSPIWTQPDVDKARYGLSPIWTRPDMDSVPYGLSPIWTHISCAM